MKKARSFSTVFREMSQTRKSHLDHYCPLSNESYDSHERIRIRAGSIDSMRSASHILYASHRRGPRSQSVINAVASEYSRLATSYVHRAGIAEFIMSHRARAGAALSWRTTSVAATEISIFVGVANYYERTACSHSAVVSAKIRGGAPEGQTDERRK